MAAPEHAHAENLATVVEVNPAGGQEGRVQDQLIFSDEVAEVLQDKPKKGRRSRKPPRVPISDEVIPSSETGASASGTAHEQGEGSLSEKQKKKRSRRSASVGRIQSPGRADLIVGIEETVIDDSKTAAWFANIQYYGHRGPLTEALVSDPNFRLARKLYHRGEVSRKSCSDAQAQRGIEVEHMKSVETELQAYRQKCGEAEQLAIQETMRTFCQQVSRNIDRAKEKIKALGGNPNIEFARIFREAPDSFDAEVARAESWLPNVAGGDVEFNSLFVGLDSDLFISPISSDLGTARDNGSLETLAADVRVRTLDGSMTGEIGEDHDDEYINIDD
ncbi:hypothetical protein AALP_AA1G186000 [Arabis alpina]|nr:hypothetical protein AALP_AA1G186000 [Arabis alpina]